MVFNVVLVEIDRIRQRRKHEGGEKPKEDDMDYKKKMKEAMKKFMPIIVSALVSIIISDHSHHSVCFF